MKTTDMDPIVVYDMDKNSLGRMLMGGFPAKYHFPFMLFSAPKGSVRESLYKHELIHHYQVQRDGYLNFNRHYIEQLMTVGYMQIDYEVEAYAGMYEPLTEEEMKILKITPDDLPKGSLEGHIREYSTSRRSPVVSSRFRQPKHANKGQVNV